MLGDRAWQGKLLAELCALIVPVFAQARSRLAAFAYVAALLEVAGDRKSCWQMGEQAGHATPRRMQALLAEYAWDWRAVLVRLQRFILAHLADSEAILVLDETAELKKGTMTVGVARQHAGITGQIENCQTVVFLAYVTGRAHTLFDFRLYLPKQWCEKRRGRPRAGPRRRVFATKTEQGTEMVAEAVAARVPFSRAAGDEAGRSSKLRAACEDAGKGYVFAVPVGFKVTTGPRRPQDGRRRTGQAGAQGGVGDPLLRAGCKGHRDYEWALAATSSPRHWVPIRRKISDPAELAFFYAYAPGPVSLSILIKVAGKRWPVEERFQQGKGQTGLDQHQLRLGGRFTGTPCYRCAPSRCSPSRPPGHPTTGPLPDRRQHRYHRPARTLARHRPAPRPPRPEATPRHRPDPRDRTRGAQAAHPLPRPRTRQPKLSAVPEHLVKTPPGTRPMAPLPGATPGRRSLASKINTEQPSPGGRKTRTVVPAEQLLNALHMFERSGPLTVDDLPGSGARLPQSNLKAMHPRWVDSQVTSARVVYRPGLLMGVASARKGGHRVILWKTSHSASEGDTTVTAPSSIDPARFLRDQLASASPDLLARC